MRSYFNGMQGVEFTNLKEEKIEINDMKKENQTYIKTFYMILVIVISIQICIVLYDQYYYFKKPYAYLAAIGFSVNQIIRIYQYDLLYLLKNILLGGSLAGITGTYVIHWFWREDMYIKYIVPWKHIIIPNIFICSIMIVMQLFFFIFYQHTNVKKALEESQEIAI